MKIDGGIISEYIQYAELKRMAYNIAALQQEKMFHSLAVLSYFPGEGKTLFSAALAMAYADTCRSRVLVIDTANHQNKDSLVLKQCLPLAPSLVEVKSLDEARDLPLGIHAPSSEEPARGPAPVMEPEIVDPSSVNAALQPENALTLLKKVVEDRSSQYGLVLLDTAPIKAKNKSNMDPFLVARRSDASVLIVSRKILDALDIQECLKAVEDPTLHLVGIVANEQFS